PRAHAVHTNLRLDLVGRLVGVALRQENAASSDVLKDQREMSPTITVRPPFPIPRPRSHLGSQSSQEHSQLISGLSHVHRLAERLQTCASILLFLRSPPPPPL